jgi:hypothetical protein
MKKIIISILLSAKLFTMQADEGMWLPMLLKQMNEKDMKLKGFKLTAEDLYSINKSSLKDAVLQFGGGCTGELISDQGLLLTNHHCGFSAIQSHSSVENDYISKGYWAMNKDQEMTNPGLTATFIVRMEDVTAAVLKGTDDKMEAKQKAKIIADNIKALETTAITGTHYEAFVRNFYYGNAYYMFVTETFKDVRFVGAPPKSIGAFGGDADNWVWPRHTGDFSLFRIYAGKDNKPAEYSKDNVPYKPKKFFTISLKGYKEGDFSLVYGFPGRTTEYLTSNAVDLLVNQTDPDRVSLREKRLNIWKEAMGSNDTTRIQYAAKYAGVANYWKKWKGEMFGLKKFDAVEKKKKYEVDFMKLVLADPMQGDKYKNVLNDLAKIYDEYKIVSRQVDYYAECLFAIEALAMSRGVDDMLKGLAASDPKVEKSFMDMQKNVGARFKDYNMAVDKKIAKPMFEAYFKNTDKAWMAPIMDSMLKAHGTVSNLLDYLYNNSAIPSSASFTKTATDKTNFMNLKSDPMIVLAKGLMQHFNLHIAPRAQELTMQITELQKQYMAAQMLVMKKKTFYPDANSTLRVTYGAVKGSAPHDGMTYKYYTTMDGLMAKEDENDPEFVVPTKLKELWKAKDYGQYADKTGELRVCFTAANHTTGGNSGSPVLNDKGELIGTNFDRSWESTMSDVMYNPDICRNITLDVRYTLFVIDKFAGAGYLLSEMKLVK